jgi:hypothetical protein
LLRRVVWYKFTDVSEALPATIIVALIALMMAAVTTPGTSINFYQTTWRNLPEDSHFQPHHSFLGFTTTTIVLSYVTGSDWNKK